MDNMWINLNYAVHPGEILQEYLEDGNITQREVARKTGLNKTIVNEIIKGKRPITMKTAIKLEKVFSFNAKFWCNLQMIYDEVIERLKLSEEELSCNTSISVSETTEREKADCNLYNNCLDSVMIDISTVLLAA